MYLKIYRKNTHKTLLEIIKRNVVGGGGVALNIRKLRKEYLTRRILLVQIELHEYIMFVYNTFGYSRGHGAVGTEIGRREYLSPRLDDFL